MQVTVNKLSPVLVELDIEVEADRVKSELDKAYGALSKSARIRGFRPGKAPRRIIRSMFGARVAADVAQRLVDETYPEAISGQSVQPVSNPAFEPKKLVENEPFSYKARVEIVPAVEKVEYAGLEAKRPKTDVTDEQLAQELEQIRKDNATLEPPKKAREAKKEDVVTIDFEVSVGGKDVEDAGAEDFQVELGGGQLIKDIDEALFGCNVGDSVEVDIDLPEAHPHPDLKGKTATFHVTIKDLKERVLPELDDEFAKDIGEFEDLDALKKDVKEQIAKRHKEAAENSVAEQLVQQLVQKNPIPLPPTLVERQNRLTEQEVIQQARRQGQTGGKVSDELKAKIRADSEVKVRAGLLMAEIAKAEKIQIGDEQIEEGLQELAEQTGKNVAKLRVEYRDQKKREMLIGMILENKVLDIIEAQAKITDEK